MDRPAPAPRDESAGLDEGFFGRPPGRSVDRHLAANGIAPTVGPGGVRETRPTGDNAASGRDVPLLVGANLAIGTRQFSTCRDSASLSSPVPLATFPASLPNSDRFGWQQPSRSPRRKTRTDTNRKLR